MVRTSRNGAPSASVDALDNLNLDDMFADEGDALFDGLDIDLGNMDDITGGLEDSGPPMSRKSDSSGPLHLDDMETEDDSRKRRKTKRKIKSPMFYEDEDDDYVEEMSKKKKKRSSAKAPAPASTSSATRKRPSTARGSAPKPSPILEVEAPPAAPARQITGKSKGRTSLSMPPPHSRQGSSAVAAAGQFGGRQTKRGNSFAVPKVSKTKSSASLPPIPATAADTIATTTAKAQRAQSVTLASTMAQIQATHPGLNQSPFCGLLPSNTLFYPFMPALPPEPTFKQRKIFAMVDRIHSSFMSHLSAPTGSAASSGVTPVKETEPIFTLMQEAFKEEKGAAEASAADRIASVGNAVGALRRSISLFEKNRLAGDLLAVAALLKRQYDFLRQNNANMEQWCRSHFTDEDFAMIYVPPKNKAKKRIAESAVLTSTSILKSLTSSDVKVKVICNGFKEPTLAPLVAHVLPLLGPAKSKSKKRKAPPPVAPKPVVPTAPVDVPEAKPPVVPYSELRPNKRRRSIADLIALTGRHLEAKYLQRFDDQRQAIDKQQSEMRKLVDEDTQGLHTLGMWQWLEKSGYFANISEPDIRWRLDGLISPAGTGTGPGCPSVVLKESEGEKTSKAPGGSLVQRLQSLLICDDAGVSGDETDDESDLYDDEKVGMRVDLDLTGLTVDERSFLYLNSIGLVESELPRTLQLEAIESVRSPSCERVHPPSNSDTVGRQRVQNANQGYRLSNPREGLDELGVIVNAMVGDLSAVNELNSRRTHFLEAVAKTHRRVESESHQAEEGSVLLKYQQMMKSKELKNKNGKAKVVKNDEHALPW